MKPEIFRSAVISPERADSIETRFAIAVMVFAAYRRYGVTSSDLVDPSRKFPAIARLLPAPGERT